ncbi:hypothetical protein K438DRAFT_610442 [Mycena galopus ATCC 62051]|nr:hypothetical protein K438DRAFT_610442 [Mycena galopus ATCC 62051]
MSGAVTIPHEVWLRIFALVDSTRALGCVVLVCRKFHNLGTEALVRHISWRSTKAALNHLDFWDRHPFKAHLVRSVYFSLSCSSGGSTDDYPQIFGCIQSFSRLEHIRLAMGPIPDVLYPTLQYLPSVTHLTLESCVTKPPPPFFPYSFPSTNPPGPIQVTNLKVSKVMASPFLLDAVTIPIVYHLPHLRAFVTDTISGLQLPSDVSAQLSSLTLTLHGATGDIQPRLDILLHRMPALTHLDVSVMTINHPAPHTSATVSPTPSPPLPLLHTLCAPWPLAGHIVPGTHTLTNLRVVSPIPKTNDAIWLLECLRGTGAPVRAAALSLHTWDDEVLLAAARCLPECEAMEIVYQRGDPSDDFLFDLGIHHLPLMRSLHTLRLFLQPPAVTAVRIAPRAFGGTLLPAWRSWRMSMSTKKKMTVPPTTGTRTRRKKSGQERKDGGAEGMCARVGKV